MIGFRCWYCNRAHGKPETQIGEKFRCGCESLLRVPSQPGGNSRVYTLTDFVVELVVYGGGGALLGFGLSMVMLVWWLRGFTLWSFAVEAVFVAGLTLLGLILGTFFGEKGVNWVGRKIRDHEDTLR